MPAKYSGSQRTMANAYERRWRVIVVVMGDWRTGANVEELKCGVPCRHHIKRLSAGDLIGNAEVENIVPAIMPAKDNHEAF